MSLVVRSGLVSSLTIPQNTVATGVAFLRHAVAQVDRVGVFSSNETKEDISTSDLKYVLAPFYLGEVASRTRTPDPAARLPVVKEAGAMMKEGKMGYIYTLLPCYPVTL